MEIIKRIESLHHRYPRQTNSQPVFIEIDPAEGKMSADWNGEIGNAVPAPVWHNRILRYTLAKVPTVRAINQLMADILPLAERLIAGHTEEWDGNNYVGRMTDDAREANDEIERICSEFGEDEDEVQLVWDGDFLYDDVKNASGIDATDEDIATSIKKIEEAAEAAGAIISIDLETEINHQRMYNRERET